MKDLISSIKDEREKENIILYSYYDKNEYLRIFTGIQINFMMKLLREKNYSEIRNLFSPFINNISIVKSYWYWPIKFSSQDSYENKLSIVSNYLKNIIGDNSNNIFEKSIIKTEYKNNYKGENIYIKSFDKDEFEEDILKIFFNLTGNLPSLSNLFIFDEETLEQEYVSFLYKIKKTDSNCLFVLVIKSCKNENEINLLEKIKELIIKNNNKRKTIFIILYSDQLENKIKKYIEKFVPFNFDNKSNCEKQIKEILKKELKLFILIYQEQERLPIFIIWQKIVNIYIFL